MTMRVSFDLEDEDLAYFQKVVRGSSAAARNLGRDAIIGHAQAVIDKVPSERTPEYVLERLVVLQTMMDMLGDEEWSLRSEDAQRVLNALAYFSEAEDLIPDHTPGLGFLDDAIMIELVSRELRHEIDAYRDFCAFRSRPKRADASREEWLRTKRQELHSRMRRRRGVAKKRSGSSWRSTFSLG